MLRDGRCLRAKSQIQAPDTDGGLRLLSPRGRNFQRFCQDSGMDVTSRVAVSRGAESQGCPSRS